MTVDELIKYIVLAHMQPNKDNKRMCIYCGMVESSYGFGNHNDGCIITEIIGELK